MAAISIQTWYILSTACMLAISALNEHAPRIVIEDPANGRATIKENSWHVTYVARIKYYDDDGDYVFCDVDLEDKFILHSYTLGSNMYKMETIKSFDRETKNQYMVNVICNDTGTPSRTTTVSVIVDIVDDNDNSPVFVDMPAAVSVPENKAPGYHVLTVYADDLDIGKNAKVSYDLNIKNYENSMLQIDSKTGEITTGVMFDHEAFDSFLFQVMATDGGSPQQYSIINFNERSIAEGDSEKDIGKIISVRIVIDEKYDNNVVINELFFK